ncbi:hypothetical protein [Mycobacteroides abscessus]|uniref:hypothetical protein n=1 Tax=Mycobacteroides abscessus TaxID=36809 RepID=UPI000D9C1D54|nr:hypothetical protein [Mycobacteroides abscessus]SPX87674.1 Uncharacterised protein [Mycobacteroides abscessus]
MDIEAQMRVYVTTATGREVECLTTTQVVPGRDMPVVWVTSIDPARAWKMRDMPWPAQYVRPA